jgi:DNA-binding winged helix-turn-helix (wHTH) protein/Tol biopolymer transport system component
VDKPVESVAPLPDRRFLAFGPFRLDPANRLLFRDGHSVPITAKAFDLLLYFIENNGRLLTKDDVLEAVWSDSFVEEGNLARHVSMVRKALGEDPKDHAYIVTVPGRGYRFVASVSMVGNGDAHTSTTLEPVSDQQSRPWRARAAVAAALFGAAVVALALVPWIRSRIAAPAAADSLRLEWGTNTGDVYAPTVSRDGAYMAYCWITPHGEQGLRIRQVAGGGTVDVVPPAPVSYWAIRFSPQGDGLYYVIGDDATHARGTLFHVPTLGGRSERVLDHVSGGIAPSPDGRSVAFVRLSAAPELAKIMVVGATGGEPRTIMNLDRPAVVQSLDWAPDGRTLLFALKRRDATGSDGWQVAEVRVEGGPTKVIVPPRPTAIIAAAWLPHRSGLLMSAVDPESRVSQIWRVSYPDGATQRLTDDLNDYKDVTVTADGTVVVTQSLGHLVQLWTAPGADPATATQIASGTVRGAYDALAWTADRRLLYRWRERGIDEIWRMSADGSDRRPLTANSGGISHTSISHDGRFIFFVSTRSGSPQIWRMKSDGDDLRELTRLKSSALHPVAAADGRWVYFTADERGVPTLWKMTIDGDSIEEVSDRPIELFDISPDSKWLAYSYRDPHLKRVCVTVAPLDGSAPPTTFDIQPTYALRWTPDGRGLTFTHEQGNIWMQPLTGGHGQALSPVRPGFTTVAFAWSQDAQYLAYTLMASPVDAIGFRLISR